ncbi:hypothetical protein [Pseudonocardia sp.]|uniref:hypothetical protein n=1 Tax=Pseudonocardia sp. TaxID=60912 RepID=UPI003D0D1540
MPTAPPLAVPRTAVPSTVPSTALDMLLARQAGVITRAQALAAGLSPDAVDHRLRTRRWRPLHPRVYLAAGHLLGDEARVRAALHWAGEGAVLAGSAAAWWHGIVTVAPATVDVTVPRARRPRPRPGVRVRRRGVAAADRTVVRGVPVAAAPLAVLEAAAEAGERGAPLLDRALQEHVAFPAVVAAHRRRLGAHGSAAAGRLLDAAADRAGAAARTLLDGLLHRSGLPGWCTGPPGDGATALLPPARVVVAVRGWAWRPGAPPAASEGWTLLRCEWHHLAQHPQAVLAQLRAAVERA